MQCPYCLLGPVAKKTEPLPRGPPVQLERGSNVTSTAMVLYVIVIVSFMTIRSNNGGSNGSRMTSKAI
jgi:hypothetical protein